MFPFDQITKYLSIQTAVERSIMETLGQMQLQLQHLAAQQRNLEELVRGRRLGVPSDDGEDDADLPLLSIEDLETLEEKLKSKQTKNKLVTTIVNLLVDTILCFAFILAPKTRTVLKDKAGLKHNPH